MTTTEHNASFIHRYFDIKLAIWMFIIIGASIILGILIQKNIDEGMIFLQENNTSSNKSVNTAAIEMYNEVKSFFYYNRSNIDKMLNDSQLKVEGGVCWHYADYYNKLAKSYNLSSKTISIVVNKTMNHKFTIISNDDGYCILDQDVYPYCIYFNNEVVKGGSNGI